MREGSNNYRKDVFFKGENLDTCIMCARMIFVCDNSSSKMKTVMKLSL